MTDPTKTTKDEDYYVIEEITFTDAGLNSDGEPLEQDELEDDYSHGG